LLSRKKDKFMTTQNQFSSLFDSDSGTESSPQKSRPMVSSNSLAEMEKQAKKPFYAKKAYQFGFLAAVGLAGAFWFKGIVVPESQVAQSKSSTNVAAAPLPEPVQPAQAASLCVASSTVQAKQACEIARLNAEGGKNTVIRGVSPVVSAPPPANVSKVKSLPVARQRPQTIVRYVEKPVERVRTVERVVYRNSPLPNRSQPAIAPIQAYRRPPLSPEETYKNLGDQIVVEGGNTPVATNAAFNPNESSPYPVVGDVSGSSSEALTAMNSAPPSSLGYIIPMGAKAKAEFQQELSWNAGEEVSNSVLLKLSTPFKDRSGKEFGQKESYVTARFSKSDAGCGFTLELSDINKAPLPSGAIIATSKGDYRQHGGSGIGRKIASGLLNLGSNLASSSSNSRNLGFAAGASVLGSVVDSGQESLSQSSYAGRQPATCHIPEGKTLKLLTTTEVQ
jgi:hypothetical protein